MTHRILSLIPSTTEIVCALGFEAQLVGRSHECDFPASVRSLPILTEAKLDSEASSRAIDDRVKQLVGDGLSVYRVDAGLLRKLEPTVILTQDHCDVCAASLEDLEAALTAWLGERPDVLSLSPSTLDGVWQDIRRVGVLLGVPGGLADGSPSQASCLIPPELPHLPFVWEWPRSDSRNPPE